MPIRANEWMKKNECNEWWNEWLHYRRKKRSIEQLNEWMNKWLDEWMNEWMNILQSLHWINCWNNERLKGKNERMCGCWRNCFNSFLCDISILDDMWSQFLRRNKLSKWHFRLYSIVICCQRLPHCWGNIISGAAYETQSLRWVVICFLRLRPWGCRGMETPSALLALCEGNPPVTDGFPSQRVSNAKRWYFLWYQLEQAVEQAVDFPVICLRRQCDNEKHLHATN